MSLAQEIAQIHRRAENITRAQKHGLTITPVAWEDTGRSKNSSLGPNISDLTLNADDHKMPLIRKPNFSDVTADVPIHHFQVTVGNETPGAPLQRIPLKEYLLSLGKYAGAKADAPLAIGRDDVVLCSAQACVLPLGESGEVDFVPEIFSYQATGEEPAVLVIVASAQGTSAHAITERDQKLLFNRGGQATKFSAKRLREDRKERGVSTEGEMDAEEMDRNALIIYQIPLKQTERPVMFGGGSFPVFESMALGCGSTRDGSARRPGSRGARRAGMDFAMLRSSDKSEGTFKGLGNFRLERDERFPIRATVQMYRLTDDVDISEDLFHSIHQSIESVYNIAEAKGSLVIDTTNRKTETTVPPLTSLGPLPTGSGLFSAFNQPTNNGSEAKNEGLDDFVEVGSTF